jgi:hypothetical protein
MRSADPRFRIEGKGNPPESIALDMAGGNSVMANLNGVLELTLPKSPASMPRKIAVHRARDQWKRPHGPLFFAAI